MEIVSKRHSIKFTLCESEFVKGMKSTAFTGEPCVPPNESANREIIKKRMPHVLIFKKICIL